MASSLNPKNQFQSALQSRQAEQQRQTKFFKVTVPIALVFHALAIGGLTILAQRGVPEIAAEEVEIVADNPPLEPKETSQPIDPNGQGADLAGGGGGSGSNKFSLFQTEGGASDGNNIAALGNPFTTPEAPNEVTTPVPEASAETPAIPETIPEESKKPESKKLESKKLEAPKTESKIPSKDPTASLKMGELNGKKEGKGDKGDPNGGKLNPNAPTGAGKAGGTGSGRGPGNGSGTGTGNGSGSGSGSGSGTGRLGNPGQTPIGKPSESKPERKPEPTAIVQQTQATPKKKSPKCIENCDFNEYLGAEGSLRISQEIDKNGNATVKLLQSSGDSELDRKALEAIKRRKYETSDDGYSSNVRVTSQQEGSDFARQQEIRRQQEQSDRNAINRDRILQDPERQTREAGKPPTPVVPAEPAPIGPEPVVKPVSAPVREPILVPIPEAIVQTIPEPVVPTPVTPEPIIEPIAPVVEPVAPVPVAEPIAPLPVAPVPAPPSSP